MAIDTPISDQEKVALAIGLGGVGAALVALGLGLFGKGGGTNPPGENLGNPTLTPAPGPASIVLPHGSGGAETTFTLHNPTAMYSGPGRNTYTFAQVIQNGVTVMASGVAGTFLQPSVTQISQSLVAANQVQVCIPSPDQRLTLFSFQSTDPCAVGWYGFCGRPSVPGLADLHLQIFQDSNESKNACDADGFPSPTCGCSPPTCVHQCPPRTTYRDVIFRGVVKFT